jgi:hypothetical protein
VTGTAYRSPIYEECWQHNQRYDSEQLAPRQAQELAEERAWRGLSDSRLPVILPCSSSG